MMFYNVNFCLFPVDFTNVSENISFAGFVPKSSRVVSPGPVTRVQIKAHRFIITTPVFISFDFTKGTEHKTIN
jgi:hypothetical protein